MTGGVEGSMRCLETSLPRGAFSTEEVRTGIDAGKALGLMLAWGCDFIMASDDAILADPVVRMGITDVEYLAHPWVMGPRVANKFRFPASVSVRSQRGSWATTHSPPPRSAGT